MHTVHSETGPELSLQPRGPSPPPFVDPERNQKRLLLALGVLLVALVAVILKNWDFWFPPAAEQEYAGASAGKKGAKVAANVGSSRQRGSSTSARERKIVENSKSPSLVAAAATTERAALPDLQVEVVAGNQRKTLTARSNAIHLDLASPSSNSSAPVTSQETVANSANHVQMSAQAAETVSRPVAPEYPLLARQMKVQGAVILQALISRDGAIQGLQIVSGPNILATAAREAVKQWHFRPYYQNGQPIQTQARITVNFTISTN